MPGAPSPYHTEYIELQFGEWVAKESEFKPRLDRPRLDLSTATPMEVLQAVRDAMEDDDMLSMAKQYHLLAHDVRLLFGTRKLRYEVAYVADLSKRGRIDCSFANICGIFFNDTLNTGVFQVSAPPETFIGQQTLAEDGYYKSSAQYSPEQHDFSNGAIKKNRIHTVTLESRKYRALKKKISECRDLAAALSTGVDLTAIARQFTSEEIAASMQQTKGRKRLADDNEAGTSSGPSASAAASVQASSAPPRPSTTFLPNLLDECPSAAGPWLRRCVDRWNLIAPFDPAVTEMQWRAYYKERAALDWWVASNGGKGIPKDDDADGDENLNDDDGLVLPEWKEDFPLVDMGSYPNDEVIFGEMDGDSVLDHTEAIRDAVGDVIKGCPRLGITPEHMESCVYFLGGEINWAGDTYPRTADYVVRMYSPCGLGTSLEINVTWHYRTRMYFAEHFGGIQIDVRAARNRRPERPVAASESGKWLQLCEMSEEDSGYQERTLLSANRLRDIEKVLLGRHNSISEIKVRNS